VLVLAKAPVAGAVKTRLCPPLDLAEAARLAEAALADTLAAVAGCGAARRVLVLAGRPGPFVPPGVEVLPQRAGSLGDRLAGAFADAGQAWTGPTVLIGMDTPQVGPGLLDRCAGLLGRAGTDAVIGPALDGGYWLIGVRGPAPDLFAGVPMSTAGTFAAQRRRLADLGLRCALAPRRRDVDHFADALAVAGESARSRFAAALAAVSADRTERVRATPVAAGHG
jgi:rSAM/selenodomain-associated transferase 1